MPYRGSHCQLFCSDTVGPIICFAVGFEALRAALLDLSSPKQGRLRLSGVAAYTPLARQRLSNVSASTN